MPGRGESRWGGGQDQSLVKGPDERGQLPRLVPGRGQSFGGARTERKVAVGSLETPWRSTGRPTSRRRAHGARTYVSPSRKPPQLEARHRFFQSTGPERDRPHRRRVPRRPPRNVHRASMVRSTGQAPPLPTGSARSNAWKSTTFLGSGTGVVAEAERGSVPHPLARGRAATPYSAHLSGGARIRGSRKGLAPCWAGTSVAVEAPRWHPESLLSSFSSAP